MMKRISCHSYSFFERLPLSYSTFVLALILSSPHIMGNEMNPVKSYEIDEFSNFDTSAVGLCKQSDVRVVRTYKNASLFGNENAGDFKSVQTATDKETCISACCAQSDCHVAVFQERLCRTVVCRSVRLCQVVSSGASLVFLDLVVVRRPTDENVTNSNEAEWAFAPLNNQTHLAASIVEGMNIMARNSTGVMPQKKVKCEIGLSECGDGEECVITGNRRRDGFCECEDGRVRNEDGICVLANSTLSTSTLGVTTNSPSSLIVTTGKPLEKLVVNVNNKTVYLDANSSIFEGTVTLSAYAIGASSDFQYEWTFLEPNRTDIGSVRDMHSQTITLTRLPHGVYDFRVVVTSVGGRGEAVANVTVLPPHKKNEPPKAIITPAVQEIKLPNSGVILEGSGSTDDNGIVSYHWQLVSGPLGYQFNEQSSATLKLSDLVPGNYSVMLKVKDKEGLESNATAFVTVIKETDYPPTANAGGDQIIYLPKREIILNGNASTDDHGIVEWEWTKGPEDSGKAVDMQDTRTQYLVLSNLEEGHYQFTLKVTDSRGQSSSASVNVYVKKPDLAEPKANAGDDVQLTLPKASVVLDGTKTTDTSTSTQWLWMQISGPNEAKFSSVNESRVTASGLTKGMYVFRLTVSNRDASDRNSSDNVTVTVIQEKNELPKANAGGDQSFVLPIDVIIVDGSKSTDDVKIVRWLWQREGTSLAAGRVLNESHNAPILMFNDVVMGVYIWKLTVWDDQGASASDSVSIIVKESIHKYDEVYATVGVDISSLSSSQLLALLRKLELFLHSGEKEVNIRMLSLTGSVHAGSVVVKFVAEVEGHDVMKGTEVAHILRRQIWSPENDLLEFPLLEVDTVVCQNNCSGHGDCNEASRECRCSTWWLESFTRRRWGDGIQNCDWSVVYVFVIVCVILIVVIVGGVVARVFVRRRRLCGAVSVGNGVRGKQRRRQQSQYTLLDSHEEQALQSVHHRSSGALLDSVSESESESDVLFDSRRKNGNKTTIQKANGVKLHKIRT